MRSILTISLIAFSLSAFGQSTALRLASDVWPPFTNYEGESAFALDLVKEALRRADAQVTIQILEFENVIEGIQSGVFDGSAALWLSPEREEFLLYSAPYLQNRLILVGRKGSDVNAAALGDLAGSRVAIVGTYAYGPELENAKEVVFVAGSSDQENLGLLMKGDVDYILADDLLVQYLLDSQPDEAAEYLAIGTTPLITRSLHFAVRKDHDQAWEIIDAFNREVRGMMGDGTYNTILHLDWVTADINGDGKDELITSGAAAGETAPSAGYDIVADDSTSDTGAPYNNYHIEGQTYQGWSNVPDRYKVNPSATQAPSGSGFGMKLKF